MTIFVNRSRVLQISLYAILSAFAVEMVFGIVYNSLALITDSIHALLDSVVTVVLLLAARMAIKPPDAEHTYGHGKIESLGGLIGGIAILLIAAFFVYEAIDGVQSPPPVMLPGLIAISAGIYTIGVDVFRIILLRKSIKKMGGSTLKADFYHAFMDLGSTMVAIIGIILVTYGFYYGDFVAALVLGVLLAILSIKLVYNSAMDLTDVISPKTVSKIRDIVANTKGVINTGPVLVRKSGDIIFADITISLRGDVSFDRAHEISHRVEQNIKDDIPNVAATIHFEPTWEKIPRDSKIGDIASSVQGVREAHNISSYSSEGKMYVSLHVMVDKDMNLDGAHKISEVIEERIQVEFSDIEHITIHLEPHAELKGMQSIIDEESEGEIRNIINEYSQIRGIGRIVTLYFQNVVKIDIDCSFDKDLSIEKVHELTSEIERKIHGNLKNAIITIHPEPV